MKELGKNFLIFTLIVILIFPSKIFAQIPVRDLDERADIEDWGEFVGELTKKVVGQSGIILGSCAGFSLADAFIDYLGDLLGSMLKDAVDYVTKGLKNFLTSKIAIFETDVPTKVRNFSEYVNMQRIQEAFTSCVDKTLSMYFATIINEIGMSLLGWIRSGFKGTPLFVYSYQAITDSALDAALGEFMYQFNPLGIGRMLCSPTRIEDFRFILSFYTIQPPPTLNTFRCRLTDIYQNIEEFKTQVQQQFDNPWKLLEINIQNLALEDPNWRYSQLLKQKEKITAQTFAEIQASISDGFISGFTCIEKDENGICRKRVISHPASINKELMLLGMKTPLEEVFRRAQNVQGLKDLGPLLQMWGIVLSNNAVTTFIHEGLKRSLAKKGVSFTEQDRYLSQALTQSSSNYFKKTEEELKNILNISYYIDKSIASSTTILNSINTLIDKINRIAGGIVINTLNEPAGDFLIDKAIILGISDVSITNYDENNAKNIYTNLNSYKNSFGKSLNDIKDYIVTTTNVYLSKYQDNLFATDTEKASEFLVVLRSFSLQLSKYSDEMDKIINFAEFYTKNKDYQNYSFDSSQITTVSSTLDELINKVNQNCTNQQDKSAWEERINYYIYVKDTLTGYSSKQELNSPLGFALRELQNKIEDDKRKFNNNCPSP